MIPLFRFFSAIVVGSVTYGILSTYSATDLTPPQVSLNEIVGYVEVSPGICEVNTMGEDNEIYTFQKECDK